MQRRYTIGADSIWISDGVELGDRSRVRQVVCSTGKKKKWKTSSTARTLGRREARLLFLKSTN